MMQKHQVKNPKKHAHETQDKANLMCETNHNNHVRHIVAVLSGKGGVGKSLVTSLLAVMMQKRGHHVGILDADITGPSIPKVFGTEGYAPVNTEMGLFPVETNRKIKLMSVNYLLDQGDSPVIWRGPLLSGMVKQFWTDVIWGDLDYLFIDMPPGTGDVPLTAFQSIPLNGIIIVTSPQDLVSLIVRKAFNMARKMDIPVLGMIENMSHAICPKCEERIILLGESKAEEIAVEMGIPLLGRIPIDPELAMLCDQGQIEIVHQDYIEGCIEILEGMPPNI